MNIELVFNCGATPASESLSLSLPPSVTVFVGPNNSGKSKAVFALFHLCSLIPLESPNQILKGSPLSQRTEFPSDVDEMRAFLKRQHRVAVDAYCITSDIDTSDAIDEKAWEHYFEREHRIIETYAQSASLFLDGKYRLSLAELREQVDYAKPHGPLAKLAASDEPRRRFQQAVGSALGLYPVLDPTNMQTGVRLKFSHVRPENGIDRGIEQKNVDFFRAALNVEDVSDGVRAYTGIIMSLIAGDAKYLFIDEPEAFLHPTLARRLGGVFGNVSNSSSKYVFAATHSSEFLMGAIEAGANVNIIRLDYDGNSGLARAVENNDLKELMTQPLLRSAGVMAGLFNHCVVVTEADADRAFYQEINTRLLAAGDARGIEGCLFLNGNGKDTIPTIVKLLRKAGVPAAGIVDIDLVKNERKAWSNHLESAGIPSASRSGLNDTRRAILAALKSAADNDFKRDGGIELLSGEDSAAASDFFDNLDKYGCFVVRNGELESWLPDLKVSRTHDKFLHGIFGAMGSDPSDPDYIKPVEGDVWEFMGKVGGWLRSPDRKGMPE